MTRCYVNSQEKDLGLHFFKCPIASFRVMRILGLIKQ
jgi:hypothetical protein